MAGFQLTLHGRIWVTPEGITDNAKPLGPFSQPRLCIGERGNLRSGGECDSSPEVMHWMSKGNVAISVAHDWLAFHYKAGQGASPRLYNVHIDGGV